MLYAKCICCMHAQPLAQYRFSLHCEPVLRRTVPTRRFKPCRASTVPRSPIVYTTPYSMPYCARTVPPLIIFSRENPDSYCVCVCACVCVCVCVCVCHTCSASLNALLLRRGTAEIVPLTAWYVLQQNCIVPCMEQNELHQPPNASEAFKFTNSLGFLTGNFSLASKNNLFVI